MPRKDVSYVETERCSGEGASVNRFPVKSGDTVALCIEKNFGIRKSGIEETVMRTAIDSAARTNTFFKGSSFSLPKRLRLKRMRRYIIWNGNSAHERSMFPEGEQSTMFLSASADASLRSATAYGKNGRSIRITKRKSGAV